jgi:hypothetical protein
MKVEEGQDFEKFQVTYFVRKTNSSFLPSVPSTYSCPSTTSPPLLVAGGTSVATAGADLEIMGNHVVNTHHLPSPSSPSSP